MPSRLPSREAMKASGNESMPFAARSPESGITTSLGTGMEELSRAIRPNIAA